jgi:hypothetical protein
MKLTIKIIFLAIMLISIQTKADSLLDSFDTMQNGASEFKTKSMRGVNLGNFSARVPIKTYQLFSYTPMKFEAGCGGVSAHFGGFSFISGEEIKKLIKNVGQNASGLVVYLATSVACPECASWIQKVNKHAQFAASLAINSCKMAEALVGGAANALCNGTSGLMASSGYAEDGLELQKRCANATDSFASFSEAIGLDEDGNSVDKNKVIYDCTNDEGSVPWCVLREFGMLAKKNPQSASKELLGPGAMDNDQKQDLAIVELIHTMLKITKDSVNKDQSTLTGKENIVLSPKNLALSIFGSISCGLTRPGVDAIKNAFEAKCGKYWSNKELRLPDIRVCPSSTADATIWTHCKGGSKKTPWKEWTGNRAYVFETALYMKYANSFEELFKKTTEGGEYDAADIKFINSIPLPLYKLLNLAYSYPEIMTSLSTTLAMTLSDIMIEEFFRTILDKLNRMTESSHVKKEYVDELTSSIEVIHSLTTGMNNPENTKSKNNLRSFRTAMELNIKTYQQMMFDDIANQHLGRNLKASSSSAVTGAN